MTTKTEDISLEEYQRRCEQGQRTIPVVKVTASVKVIDKDGNEKTLDFSSEEVEDATQ